MIASTQVYNNEIDDLGRISKCARRGYENPTKYKIGRLVSWHNEVGIFKIYIVHIAHPRSQPLQNSIYTYTTKYAPVKYALLIQRHGIKSVQTFSRHAKNRFI